MNAKINSHYIGCLRCFREIITFLKGNKTHKVTLGIAKPVSKGFDAQFWYFYFYLIRNEFNNNNNIEYLRANDKCSLWYWTGQEGSCYIAVAIEERLHVP